MSKQDIRREALARQGKVVRCHDRSFQIEGDQQRALFLSGGEGLVHRAVDLDTNRPCRLKCFWQPTDLRRERSEVLVEQHLPDLGKSAADALGGAPYEMVHGLGPSTPFSIVMKDVDGSSWKDLKEAARQRSIAQRYPPGGWPDLKVRATWAYGLATAVGKMEQHRFVHADLSDGNVMVTPRGANLGDMALVDFDAFVHPQYPHLDTTCKGSPGYAAPEIWKSKSVDVGSDRVGMAVLIQEFLVIGDPTLTVDEAFGWQYDQEREIGGGRGEAHPAFMKKYPELGELLVGTLRARKPSERPAPEAWRPLLRGLATGAESGAAATGASTAKGASTAPAAAGKALRSLAINSHPLPYRIVPIPFGERDKRLDLSITPYCIRATLARNDDGSVDVIVHSGATVNVQTAATKTWQTLRSGERTSVRPGMVLFDPKGRTNARIEAVEFK